MSLVPGVPIRNHRRKRFQFGTIQRACFCFSQNVAPKTFGFTVNHYQAVIPKHAGNSKAERFVLDASDIHDAIETKMSPGRRDGSVAEMIVQYLAAWPRQCIDRIGPRLAINDDAQNQFAGVQFFLCIVGR